MKNKRCDQRDQMSVQVERGRSGDDVASSAKGNGNSWDLREEV